MASNLRAHLMMFVGVIASLIWFFATGAAAAADQESSSDILDQICADWKRRQDAVSTVRYKIQGERVEAKGKYTGADAPDPFPSEDFRFTKTVTWLLDFKNNRMKKEVDGYLFNSEIRGFFPHFYGYLFDGVKYKQYTPREKMTSASYTPSPQIADLSGHGAEGREGFIMPADFPVFVAHGSIPIFRSRPEPFRLQLPINRENFSIRGQGKLDGRDCVILKSGKSSGNEYEYWVDRSRQSAVLRLVRTINQMPMFAIDLRYKKGQSGWLPEGWKLIYYRGDGKNAVMAFEDMTALSIEENLPVEIGEFQMEPSPGMRVRFEDKKGIYQMQSDGSFAQVDTRRRAGGVRWYTYCFVGALVLLLGGGAAYLTRKRWQRVFGLGTNGPK